MISPEKEPIMQAMVDSENMLRILTPENTVVKTYKNGAECCHFVYESPDNFEVYFVPLNELELLVDKGFPHIKEDIVDDHTANLYISTLPNDLDRLLKQ